MRGAWIKKCLEPFGRRILERAELRDGVPVGKEFGQWIESILDTVEVGTFCDPKWKGICALLMVLFRKSMRS